MTSQCTGQLTCVMLAHHKKTECIFCAVQFLIAFNSSVCPVHLFQQWWLSCCLSGRGLLAQLVICGSVVCWDVFVRLSLWSFGWALGSGLAGSWGIFTTFLCFTNSPVAIALLYFEQAS